MRRLPWFKLWHEARTDRKLDTLQDDEHRVWFNLLCYASEQDERGTITEHDLLAVECARADDDLLERTLIKLVRLRIVTRADGVVTFLNFNRRQYDRPSAEPDAVRERVTRHRNALLKEGNAVETHGNAAVTTCNALEESREEENRVEKSRETAGAPQAAALSRSVPKPSKGTRIPPDFTITDEMRAWAAGKVPGVDLEWHTEEFVDFWQSATKNATRTDWVLTWRNRMRDVYIRAPQSNGRSLALSNGHRATGPPRSTPETRTNELLDRLIPRGGTQ